MNILREDNSNRVRASLRGSVPVLLAVAVFLGSRWLIGRFFSTVAAVSGPEDLTGHQMLLFGCLWGITYLGTIFVSIYAARRLERSTYSEFGLNINRQWMQSFLVGVGTSMVGITLSYLWGDLRGIRSLDLATAGVRSPEGAVLTVAILLMFTGYFFLGYVYEEVVFRRIMIDNFAEGLTDRGLSRRAAVGVAAVVSLLAFGLVHFLYRGNFVVVIDAALTGTMFTFAYLLTGELALPIGVHAGRHITHVFSGESYGTVEVTGVGGIVQDTLSANLEVRLVQIGVVCLLASLWVYYKHGSVGLSGVISQSRPKQSHTD